MNISNVKVYDFILKVYRIVQHPRTIIWMGSYIINLLLLLLVHLAATLVILTNIVGLR